MTDAPEPERRWLSAATAAAYLDCSLRTIERLAASGVITRHKVGGLTRFDARQIDSLVLSGASRSGATRVE